jgi:NADPH-dependent 7-cyano-7-deazaguanine reductase QueF
MRGLRGCELPVPEGVENPTEGDGMSDCPFKLIEVNESERTTDIRIEGHITHQCPFEDEQDVGKITVHYSPWKSEIELWSFAEYLDSFAETKISHEELTRRIRSELDEWVDPRQLTVRTEFKTAGLNISVEVPV